MAKTKDVKLDDSINVPVPKRLKATVKNLAKKEPGEPVHTAFARKLIEEGVERRQLAGSK